MLAPLALETFCVGFPRVICHVEEDTTLCVFILAWYTSPHGAAFNECVCYRDALRGRGYQQITLIPTDKQPRIKLFHAEVDVILFATKRVDPRDVTGN